MQFTLPTPARQGSCSTPSLNGFSEGPGEHHQHQLVNLSYSLSQLQALQPNPRQGSSSTQSLDGFSEGPGEHHQHQLENLFESTLPTPDPSTRGKVPVQPNHWTGLAKDPASIISISWKAFLSSLSQRRALQPTDKHHEHKLENHFEFSLPTPGPSTRGKVPVQSNHWTYLAKDPASIISISWKTL